MKTLNNKKGMTLVEMIIGIMLLAIAGVMLAQSFAAAARIATRATLYKNVSSTAASTVELEEAQTPKNSDYTVEMDHKNGNLTVTYKKDGTTATIPMKGQYVVSNAESSSFNAGLTYREFLPSNFSFEVPAEVID